MSGRVKLFPSILAADLNRFGEQIREAEEAGVDGFHVDVMDGHFVPNLSYGPNVARAVRKTSPLFMEIHLMVEHPEQWTDDFCAAGANRLIAHVESSCDIWRWMKAVRAARLEVGLGVSPSTSAGALAPYLGQLDLALVMTVVPGRGGQPFLDEMLPKVTQVQAMLKEARSGADVEVDGGINPLSAQLTVGAGASALVAGTAVFAAPAGVCAAVQSLRLAAAAAVQGSRSEGQGSGAGDG